MRSTIDTWMSAVRSAWSGSRTASARRWTSSHAVMSTLALGCWVCAWPGEVSAQERGHVAGVIGVTFQTQSDGVFGGEIAGNIHPNVQIYGGVNLMKNVLPRSVQADLDELGQALTTTTGIPWSFSASARAVTGVA